MGPAFDLVGALRRIRRITDMSQRELAKAGEVSVAAVAHAEAGTRDLSVNVFARLASLAELRLALLDPEGREVAGMADDTVRDMGNRRFPAHLDTRYSDEGWWHDEHRRSRSQPWYTFDRDRWMRDRDRRRDGTPEDHQRPQPGDSPEAREAERRQAARRRRAEERERRFLAGEFRQTGPDFVCTCPPECDPIVERTADVHVEDCPCRCDIA